jgi:hypothetical protein
VQDRELIIDARSINNNDIHRPLSEDEHPLDIEDDPTVSNS